MALGGGTFVSQNKVLPGTYINVASAVPDKNENSRGVATIPLELDWGPDDKVFRLEASDFEENALKLFGYKYNHEALTSVREIFKHAHVVYFYRINSSGSVASNTYAKAKCTGTRGNSIKIIIKKNVDDNTKYNVETVIDTSIVDIQVVGSAADLIDNDFVEFKTDATLAEMAGTALSGGTNGTVSGESHKAYMDAMESYKFNVMGVMTKENDIKKVYAEYTKRMRNELGIKFQCVLYDCQADSEGIINVKNGVEVIPWIVGAQAECSLNNSCTNMLYDGELEVDGTYTQAQLETAINAGEFVLHRCGMNIRVLTDINSLVTITEEKNGLFKSNQTIRVIDQLASDTATLFNEKYIGSVLNDDNGRASLWADIVSMHKELVAIGAIENFTDSDIVVSKGSGKGKVVISDVITVAGTMEQLYMTVVIQ